MSALSEDVLKLELNEDIFKGIKFFISGEVHEKIIDLLKCGGAERLNYFSDYVTHLIVGDNPEENDIVDANDVYEIPALTPKWVVMCASLKKLVSTRSYLHVPGGKLLSNLVFCFSNIREDLNYLWSLITYNGGTVQLNLNRNCNYLVTTDTTSVKYEKAETLGHDEIKIVSPDWVVETVKNNSLVEAALFHPKLINWPKPVKHESTTAITGFEPEQGEAPEKIEEKTVSDSTQALLEKLKQRMPWNQPSTPKTTSVSDPVGPPNVVAPSYTQKAANQQLPRIQLPPAPAPQPQQHTPQSPVSTSFPQIPRSPSTSLSNQQLPRSIVHHTPTQQPNFQDQQNPLNINRLIGQQNRPNIQQLRGQLGQGQLHQQLLQQRMQQSQQNILQRPAAGQITTVVQQQLMQQQLTQGQRQLLQGQGHVLQQQQQRQVGPTQQPIGQNQQQLGQNQHMGQITQQLAQLQAQQMQLKQNQQQQQLQQQIQLAQNPQQLQMNQNQQLQMNQNQQLQLNQNQQLLQNQVLQQQNQLQQQQQSQLNQQQQNQLNQQQQQQQSQLNQQQQNQLNQQQNQLSQQQQIQLNQQQQNQIGQQQNHQPSPQQQILQPSPQQQILQPSPQQQIQMGQGQNFVQQNINQHITSQNQQILQQKQQFLNQQVVTSQQQIIQNQPNLAVQQFVNQNFGQNQNVIPELNQQNMQQQQPNLSQQHGMSQQINAQALNQQLNSQNLGQQLNQQQLNQQLNQQSQLSQLSQQSLVNQQLSQQNQMGQQLNQQEQMNQQTQQLSQINQQNPLGQQNINQQGLEQGLSQNISQALNQQLNQGLNQQLQQQSLQQQQLSRQNLPQPQLNPQQQQQISQINQQLNSGLPQQVVRTQFQQPGNISQQILINQQSPQNPAPQRAQINQHLWAQPPTQVPGQQIIRHPVNVVQQGAPRVQWSPNPQQGNVVPQRQFIHLDARTHNELQKMPPEQQALFVAKLQKQRQLLKQMQQRGGGGSHILIRGNVPPGLTTQQQVQWLQQQAKQQGIVLPPNIQQQNITPGTLTQPGLAQTIQHAPGLSPINQNNAQFTDQAQVQQLKQYRLQQLQLQREQAQKKHLAQQGNIQQPTIVRPIGQPQLADSTTNPPQVQDGNNQHAVVVNAKTKTALANMLNIKLQSGGSSIGVQRPETLPEPSAAGTLRLMTAQHNAALNSKPQDIIALQRRTISGPNGEIIKPPGASPLPTTPTNEPPKLQYCPKPALPLQHRPGPFYGHNPNLKLPPDLFLLGCIFVVVELESFLEERIPDWQQKIEKHGGEVEKQYCSRVTHVLCETQRHGVVMQALRDCKRCVTIVWLSDVMQRKQVLPPWTALHLPNIYLDTAPASKHLISISGFEGNDRNRVKHMVKYTGAKCTSYFSKHNTLLISAKADGRKCTYAKKWQIPVVNVQWLTDVMLGNFTAMNQMENQIYQQFSNPPNFSFDPKLVPNLMHAWKAPINISQESYERVKRSASPVVLPKKPKKQKTESTDENDNISEDQVANATHRILFSMIPNTKEFKKLVRDLGGAVAEDTTNFTHLVMPYLSRSIKLFFAIAKGAQVVSEQWLKDSHAANQFLPETNYNLNSKDFNYEYKCDIDQTFLTRNRNRLFEGKFFFVTPSVFPSRNVIIQLIQNCGGIVERIRRSSAQIEATSINSPYSYFIITHENDLHLVADLLKNKKDKMKIVCNVELIFSAILKQTFEVEPYAVCVL